MRNPFKFAEDWAQSVFYNTNPPTAVDIFAYRYVGGEMEILVGNRKNEPLGLALPGGFQDQGESFEQAACRELKEETGYEVTVGRLKLVTVLSNPKRDPRKHINSVSFSVEIFSSEGRLVQEDDLGQVRWVKLTDLIDEDGLITDEFIGMHDLIVGRAIRGIKLQKNLEEITELYNDNLCLT